MSLINLMMVGLCLVGSGRARGIEIAFATTEGGVRVVVSLGEEDGQGDSDIKVVIPLSLVGGGAGCVLLLLVVRWLFLKVVMRFCGDAIVGTGGFGSGVAAPVRPSGIRGIRQGRSGVSFNIVPFAGFIQSKVLLVSLVIAIIAISSIYISTTGFRSNPGWQPWMMERDNASIIAVGNPGVGKSTILNSLAEELLFKSGTSFGGGLTFQMDERSDKNGRRFFDTPGLSDTKLREEAGHAITKALRKGGNFKILFFLRTQSGRAVGDDITTLKLVLDSAPEIRNQYGIVINQVPSKLAKQFLEDKKNVEAFFKDILFNIDIHRQCHISNIAFLPLIKDVEDEKDKFIPVKDLKTIDGTPFKKYVIEKLPSVKLTQGEANDIDTQNFEKKKEEIEKLTKMMKEDKELFKKKEREFEQAQNQMKEEIEKMRKEVKAAYEKKPTTTKPTTTKPTTTKPTTTKPTTTKHGWLGLGAGLGAGTGAIVGTAILPGVGTALGAAAGSAIGSAVVAVQFAILDYFSS